MNNHYHLLIETPAASLVRGMQHLNGLYTQAFNRRHDRVRTVKDANRIVVLDQGWIVEDGTHNELRPQGGLYHRLYTRSDTGLEMKGVEATVKTGSVRFIRVHKTYSYSRPYLSRKV